jgi:hypothetical protein
MAADEGEAAVKLDGQIIRALVFVTVGLALGAALVMLAGGLQCPAEGCRAYWFGNDGLLDVLLAVGQFAAVIVGGYLAWRSFMINAARNVADRYQKGIELLASTRESTVSGGISLLAFVEAEDPDRYQMPVVDALKNVISEHGTPLHDRLSLSTLDAAMPPAKDFNELAGRSMEIVRSKRIKFSAERDHEEATRTPSAVVDALHAVFEIPSTRRWKFPQSYRGNGHLRIWSLWAHFVKLLDQDLSLVDFVHCVFGIVYFERCKIRDVSISGRSFAAMTFIDCTLTNVTIEMNDLWGQPFPTGPLVIFRNCRIDNVLVNGSADLAKHISAKGDGHNVTEPSVEPLSH